ncbi:MAG TPA: ADP-ribosylglycohydrolase family protein [Firmicutes bacterium]|nr:ADP-ribosylglycohydrolase family protein [Bacillota bacterium]
MNIDERVQGGLYGVAVGDALGATLEFMGKEIVKERYGVLTDIIGGGWLELMPGEWTDDTEMMLAVAVGIDHDFRNPVDAIGIEFLRWHKTNPPGVGTTCAAVFHKVRMGLSWHEAAQQLHRETSHTAGNGALMRTLPVALAYSKPEDIVEQACSIAQMTHWDQRAAFTCQLYCLLAHYLIAGDRFRDALRSAYSYMAECLPDDTGLEPMKTELEQKMADPQPTGYTVDTLACALQGIESSSSLEDAVISVVNQGGDADTVGAITGGLAGVYYGFKAVPKRWLQKFNLQQRKRLDDAAERMLKVRLQVS